MDSKQIGKAIQKGAKRVIVESGISSSRSGSKELSHLATKLSTQPISSLDAADRLGQQLGRKIVELSQSLNKSYLDKGVVRTLVRAKAVPSVDDLPTGISTVEASPAPTAIASPPQSAKPAVQSSSATQAGASAPAQPTPPSQVSRPPIVEDEDDDISPTDSTPIEDDGIEEETIALQSASASVADEDIEEGDEIEDEDDALLIVSTSVADEDIEDEAEEDDENALESAIDNDDDIAEDDEIEDEDDTLPVVSASVADEDIEEDDEIEDEDDIAPAKSATTADDSSEEDDEELAPSEDAVKAV